jgi:hypothetical protein
VSFCSSQLSFCRVLLRFNHLCSCVGFDRAYSDCQPLHSMGGGLAEAEGPTIRGCPSQLEADDTRQRIVS